MQTGLTAHRALGRQVGQQEDLGLVGTVTNLCKRTVFPVRGTWGARQGFLRSS